MKPTIWVFSLEPLDQRYTAQWYDHVPKLLQEATNDYKVVQVPGVQRNTELTTGAFLNFSDTNYWKSSQLCTFLEHYDQGETTPYDRFVFTDFWNPAITQLRYMSDLLDYQWKIHAIAHAGAYDPTDILGYKMPQPWPYYQEKSWFYQCDRIYFATENHRQIFIRGLNIPEADQYRAVLSGQPYEMLAPTILPLANQEKTIDVVWPHRYNADKQPEIAEDLSQHFNVFITKKHALNKTEYYKTLAASKIVFSSALHENLGIGVVESCLAGAIPVVPDRASYAEMYFSEFKYPSEWTENFDAYARHREDLIAFIQARLHNREKYLSLLDQQKSLLINKFLNTSTMVDQVIQ